jgi:alpha-N-arabinofuranosidase
MKKLLLLVTLLASLHGLSQNTITLQADKGKDTINKNEYGHFAEHLGHCI